MRNRVLIVDDDTINVDVLRKLLEDEYDVAVATGGEAGLDKINVFHPGVVLLDIMMPGMDGYEACRRIKAAADGDVPQVILVSAKASTAQRLRGYEVGADDYVVKPFDHDELLAKVRVHSRLKSTLTELAEARTRAEVTTQAKSDFLANMSHEIRTPMTAILGFAENLLDPELSESERLNAINTVRRNGQHLLQIINDILDLSKIESGKMEVEQIKCSPCQIAAEAASLMRARTITGGLSLDVDYAGPMPETILSDPTRLWQILINLLSNAVKFTKRGGIRLTARLVNAETPVTPASRTVLGPANRAEDRPAHSIADPKSEIVNPRSEIADPKPPLLQFDVIDTGVGMTQEQTAGLFRPFQQAGASTTRAFGGTGLGLTISKRFAQMLGGDVVLVESRPNRGSRFRLTVATGPLDGVHMINPHEAAAQRAPGLGRGPAPDQAQALPNCRVLLVEDGPDNQRLISFFLSKAGADVTVVENGQEGVDKTMGTFLRRRESDVDQPFDVILMDMQMPVMDGYTATRLLREKGYNGPIIALTAHAMTGEREKCLAAGCDDYAAKPIDRKKLIETVQAHLQPSAIA